MIRSRGRQLTVLALAAPVIGAALAAPASGQNATLRSNWVPNVGTLAEGELPLGDLWTFACPPGGRVSVVVDTKDDTDAGESLLDPVLIVLSRTQILAAGDDESECSFPPVCGFNCPLVSEVACEGGLHAVAVFDNPGDQGTGDADRPCAGGGGYELLVRVFDNTGTALPQQRVALGGGPARRLPGRLGLIVGRQGPALDDEGLPLPTPGPAPQAARAAREPGEAKQRWLDGILAGEDQVPTGSVPD